MPERIGPDLPPHLLAKRKRQAEEAAASAASKPSAEPAVPDNVAEESSKKRRVIGPSAPPAPLEERPAGNPNDDEDESSDDEFGPSLPGQGADIGPAYAASAFDEEKPDSVEAAKPSRRDDWMTMPPKQDDLAARMDPTKIRARGFNTSKGAKGPSGSSGPDTLWTETPEQKRKRLEDQVLGISSSTDREASRPAPADDKTAAEDEEKARKIREYNAKHRSETLYSQHQSSTKKEKEDDPSKRGWDYEKDMAAGSKIGTAQRREMLNKAANFGSRFSSGKFL